MKDSHHSRHNGSTHLQAIAIPLALAALALLCFIILQAGARYFLKQWLLDNGADSVVIETLWFNPLTGMATLNGVEIATAGNTVYSDDIFKINIGVTDLFTRDALLEKMILRDMRITIRDHKQKGLRVGSYLFSAEDSDRQPGSSLFPPWTLKIQEASFTNIAIEYQGIIPATLLIDEAHGKNLDSGSKGETGSFSFTGRLNQAPVSFKVTRFFIDDTVRVAGNISLSGMDLETLQGLLTAGVSLEGSASVDGTFSLEKTADGSTVQLFEGSVDLGKITTSGDDWSAGGDLGWQGTLRYDDAQVLGLDGMLTADSPFYQERRSATAIESGKLSAEGKATFAGTGARPFTGDLAITLVDPHYTIGEAQGMAESVSWSGTMESAAAGDTSSSRFTADGQAEAEALALNFSEETHWQQSSIGLDGTIEWHHEKPSAGTASITYSGSTSLTDGMLRVDESIYRAAQLEQEGKVAYHPQTAAKRIGFDAIVSGRNVSGNLHGQNFNWLLSTAVVRGDGTLFIGGGHLFSGKGSIDISTAEILENKKAVVTLESLMINQLHGREDGMVDVSKAAANNLRFTPSSFLPMELTIQSLLLTGLNSDNFTTISIDRAEADFPALVFMPQVPYSVTVDSLLAKGIASSSFAQYSLDHLSLNKAEVHQQNDHEAIAGTAGIVINGMQAGADALAAESIAINSAHYRGSDAEADRGLAVTLGSLKGSKATWSPGSIVTIDTLTGAGLDVSYTATEDSNTDTKSPKEGKSNTEGRARSLPLVIHSLVFEGSNRVLYKDPTLPETFEANIDITSLQFTDVNLDEADTRFSFTAKARVDKHSPLTMSGSAALLASPRIWEHELRLNGYPLTNLTPFVLKPLGKRLTGGKLELVSEMRIEDDQVDMDNTLELTGVELKTASKKRLRHFNSKLPIPLETALSFLRDGEDTITLQVPVNGTLSSLDASYADIIVTALSNGISTAVKPMLAYTVLGPGGVLAYLGMKLGKDIISSDLPELTFEAGSTRLTPEHTRQLDSIGKRIEDALADMRKPLYYVYTKVKPGELTDIDDAALLSRNQRQKLYRLGERRAENVRRYLIDRFAIKKEQLQTFQPGILYDEESEPTVTFMK